MFSNGQGSMMIGRREELAERRVTAICSAVGISVERIVTTGSQSLIRLVKGSRKAWCIRPGKGRPDPLSVVYQRHGEFDVNVKSWPFVDCSVYTPWTTLENMLNGADVGIRTRALKRFRRFASVPPFSSDEELALKLEALA